jgi:hypothetical protein
LLHGGYFFFDGNAPFPKIHIISITNQSQHFKNGSILFSSWNKDGALIQTVLNPTRQGTEASAGDLNGSQ